MMSIMVGEAPIDYEKEKMLRDSKFEPEVFLWAQLKSKAFSLNKRNIQNFQTFSSPTSIKVQKSVPMTTIEEEFKEEDIFKDFDLQLTQG